MTTKTGYELLEEITLTLNDAIFVPNSMLPERYHDNKSGGRTLDGINKVYNREVEASVERAQLKAEKAKRIAAYRAQVEAQLIEFKTGQEEVHITYDVNADKLYRNEQVFVGGMISGGVIDAEDLEDRVCYKY
jgi:hypothetical protein